MRINKVIAESGICSRRKADELISQGRVTVNGKTVTKHFTLVNIDKDIIEVDGERLKLNKPSGVVSTTIDEKKKKDSSWFNKD